MESEHSSNAKLLLFLTSCVQSLGRHTRKKIRFPHEMNKSDDMAFSVMKNKFRRGGQTRVHEMVALLASYIFIEDLPGNSTDYRLMTSFLLLLCFFIQL